MNAPITSRTLFYERLRDGSFRELDLCLVGTSLGPMWEPRTLIRASGAMVNEDVYDSAFTEIRQGTAAELASMSYCGDQWPRKFNSQ